MFLLSVAAALGLSVFQLDVSAAYLQGEYDEGHDVYCHFPPGFEREFGDPTNEVSKLLKPLYGGRDSGAIWYRTLRNFLVHELHFDMCPADEGLFRFDGVISDPDTGEELQVSVLSGWFVDDGCVAVNSIRAWEVISEVISKRFKLSSKGPVRQFLGARVIQDLDAGTVTLDLENYICAMAKKFQLDTARLEQKFERGDTHMGRLLPCSSRLQSRRFTGDDALGEEESALFHSGVGTLAFLANYTRPDISYGVSILSQFVQDSSVTHLRALYHLMGYAWLTRCDYLTYRRFDTNTWELGGFPVDSNEEVGFGDSSFADDFETRRSQTGLIVMLNGGAVAWKSVKQQVCALSTCEAESYALAELARVTLLCTRC